MARLDDGFKTIISFDSDPDIKLYEKEVQPPGVMGGGANETTTMRNTAWRTKSPKKLKTAGESTLKVAYDTAAITEIITMINVNQEITITFPDESTLVFWGWLDEFVPDSIQEGQQPTATCKIICSNQDATGDEIAPVRAAAP